MVTLTKATKSARTTSQSASPTPRAAKVRPVSRPSKDTTTVSAEAAAASVKSPRVANILSGLDSWAKVKGAEGLSLDKGQLLRRGSKGGKVRQLQEMLNQGGAKLEVDGKLGPKTQAAIRKFQKANNLSVDGIVGPKTLAALNGGGATAKTESSTEQSKAAPVKGSEPVADGSKGRFASTREALNGLPKALRKHADTFQAAGEKYGVDPRFLAAISMHETGKGTSSAFRNKNNAMGISNRKGPVRMSSVSASINKMAAGLANPKGYYRGKTTIGGVANIYAPVGAANDPNGLNGHWAKGVAKYYREMGGDPSQQVIFR